ncbi:hypothetical protein [Paraburkholderia phytofirmans]|uniref:Uncharacterized protein n=2 Tax=Paraburkholderia phytofirmans TaxID=261302 RepID=B2TCI5_PARPJ|nr:hypothetical protein [Paraburkholderia phytofirmans]ACD19409.1 conserved hypothetical protein [Paraburkholderia phytofirmans PsJN]
MSKSEYLTDRQSFDRLRKRAAAGLKMVTTAVASNAAIFFDSSDICTFRYHKFLRALLSERGEAEFAALVLRPDPEAYFFHHFSKFSALIFRPDHSDEDFVVSLNSDPGGSLADAFDANSERYIVFPLSGEWAIYADRDQELAAMAGPPEVLEFARQHYPFEVHKTNPGFVISD